MNHTRCLLILLAVVPTLLAGCKASDRAVQNPLDAEPSESAQLSVISFNIRNGRANDGPNSWQPRKPLVFDVIKQYDPDFVGLQEAYRFQMDELRENLPAYSEVGEGRDGGTRNEYSAILYRTNRFAVIDSGTFWLSDTPEAVSNSWGNRLNRICTWARFLDKASGEHVYVFNTHFDHESQNARLNSAKLIATRIAERTHDDPVILTGDFNAGADNPAIQYLKGTDANQDKQPVALLDSYRVLHPSATNAGTFNRGYAGQRDGAKIDYVFITPGIQVLEAGIDQEPREGRYPSDHYPVWATIQINPARDTSDSNDGW